jgi:uncharacterized protein YjbI with pentapeptide repeats
MNDFYKKISITSRILEEEDNSLKRLSEISGFDPFHFYNYADLSNLDVSNQSLLGLNFYGANFVNSNLDNVEYEKGAFNGSTVPEKYSYLLDGYDFTLGEMTDKIFDYFYIYTKFRESSLEAAISVAQLSYSRVAEMSGISTDTLRNARRGLVVSIDTATSIATCLISSSQIRKVKIKTENSNVQQLVLQGFDLFDVKKRNSEVKSARMENGDFVSPHQPMAMILDINQKGGFTQITKKDFETYTKRQHVIVRDSDYQEHPYESGLEFKARYFTGHRFSPMMMNFLIQNSFESNQD